MANQPLTAAIIRPLIYRQTPAHTQVGEMTTFLGDANANPSVFVDPPKRPVPMQPRVGLGERAATPPDAAKRLSRDTVTRFLSALVDLIGE